MFWSLQEVEVHELALEGKHASKAEEQAELASKLFEINQIMDAKLIELEDATARRSALIAEFEGSLSRQENFRDQLSKVFYRYVTCPSHVIALLRSIPIGWIT